MTRHFDITIMKQMLTNQQIIDEILACNEYTQKNGLSLSPQQALALANTRVNSLKVTKRLEWKSGIIEQLIDAFYDSPYISLDNYEDLLHDFITIFYDLKNNTWDTISDEDLIAFMKHTFHQYHGTIEFLIDETYRLSEHIHAGGTLQTFPKS